MTKLFTSDSVRSAPLTADVINFSLSMETLQHFSPLEKIQLIREAVLEQLGIFGLITLHSGKCHLLINISEFAEKKSKHELDGLCSD